MRSRPSRLLARPQAHSDSCARLVRASQFETGMPARAIDTARISFGLVTIPVKIYSTNEPSRQIHFHMIHEGCGERLHQQYVCPKHGVVDRADIGKGFQLTKTNLVELTRDELKALEAVASDDIGLSEFVPLAAVDPILVDASYYLAPDRGGERAYRLFRDALAQTGLAGIASYAARGKQYVVMLRPFEDGLVMHQLRYPDEVKPWSEVPLDKLPKPPAAELELAEKVIGSLRHDAFDPTQYTDEVKGRVRDLIAKKARGGEITAPEHAPAPRVTDLMAALKASLGGAGVVPPSKDGHHKRAAGARRASSARKSSARAHRPSQARSRAAARRTPA